MLRRRSTKTGRHSATNPTLRAREGIDDVGAVGLTFVNVWHRLKRCCAAYARRSVNAVSLHSLSYATRSARRGVVCGTSILSLMSWYARARGFRRLTPSVLWHCCTRARGNFPFLPHAREGIFRAYTRESWRPRRCRKPVDETLANVV